MLPFLDADSQEFGRVAGTLLAAKSAVSNKGEALAMAIGLPWSPGRVTRCSGRRDSSSKEPDAERESAHQSPYHDSWLYASEWGERVRMRGGDGCMGQVTPPAWRSTRRR